MFSTIAPHPSRTRPRQRHHRGRPDANDLDAAYNLVTVDARTNRSKGDQVPADWFTPLLDARCTHTANSGATRLGWKLVADDRERRALAETASGCGQGSITYEAVP
ncbi:hypothetical protein [Streptomyces sp. NPDC005385]|uniref:hypothetical protein n=1 Tax=Streptomyces sp. NPDC005385 TaxID=3157039 RepID=UPI0033BAFE0C